MVSVKEEGTLELEVEVFGDGLHQVVHTESVHDGEPVLGVGLPLVHEEGALHLRLLPVPLGPAELVERHLAGVSLDGHDVGVNLRQECARKFVIIWLQLTFFKAFKLMFSSVLFMFLFWLKL